MMHAQTLTTRRARPDDADAIIRLSDQLEAAASSRPGPPRPLETRLALIQEALTSGQSDIIVAEQGGVVVAYANIVIFPNIKGRREGKIIEIVVDAGLRGQGIGTHLINAVKEYFQSAEVEVFEVTTGEANSAAQRFYTGQGLKVDEVVFRGRL